MTSVGVTGPNMVPNARTPRNPTEVTKLRWYVKSLKLDVIGPNRRKSGYREIGCHRTTYVTITRDLTALWLQIDTHIAFVRLTLVAAGVTFTGRLFCGIWFNAIDERILKVFDCANQQPQLRASFSACQRNEYSQLSRPKISAEEYRTRANWRSTLLIRWHSRQLTLKNYGPWRYLSQSLSNTSDFYRPPVS